jgi:predicted ATPase
MPTNNKETLSSTESFCKTKYQSSYKVDGFRSLSSFVIDLTSGLNVLVGPNGSGKTNFIEFLDFLSSFILNDASTAVSKSGGVSRVFSAEQTRLANSRVRAYVSGTADLAPYSNDEVRTLFDFDYEVEIRFNKEQSLIFVASEMVRFRKLYRSADDNVPAFPVGSISIKRQISKLDGPPTIKVSPRLLSNAVRNPLRVRHRYEYSAINAGNSTLIGSTLAPDQSVLSTRPTKPALEAIRAAIMRGRSFNLLPARAKSPDEITRPPSINFDGSGLTSTLYHLQRSGKLPRPRIGFRPRFNPSQFSDVLIWTNLVFPELKNVVVTADPHTGKYIGQMVIGENELKIPLQSASDGTVKWLALVVLIITRGGVYSIEEPENFLHPKMQQILIDLIRDYSADPEKPGYFIMSSHSETIINRCQPEELILFDFIDGRTVCKRLNNSNAVREEINRTGFGLGYYYANNAVS